MSKKSKGLFARAKVNSQAAPVIPEAAVTVSEAVPAVPAVPAVTVIPEGIKSTKAYKKHLERLEKLRELQKEAIKRLEELQKKSEDKARLEREQVDTNLVTVIANITRLEGIQSSQEKKLQKTRDLLKKNKARQKELEDIKASTLIVDVEA